MATLEKRIADLEYVVGHLPEDLDARFKLAAIREVLALHTTRFTTLERRLDTIEGKLDQIIGKLSQP
jgi:ribosomal protein S4